MKKHKQIYKELAEKFKLPVEVIEKITDSQFEFLKHVISKGEDEQVRLQYLGLFMVKPGRRETVRKRRQRMKDIRYGKEKGRQKK